MENFTVLYHSPNIARVIKSRISIWASHKVRLGEDPCGFNILTYKSFGKIPLVDCSIRMKIKINRYLCEELDPSVSGYVLENSCECCIERAGSISHVVSN